MLNDTLKKRTVKIAKVSDVSTPLAISLEINIEAALPLFRVHDDLLNRTKYLENNSKNIKAPTITIVDPTYQEKYGKERFIFVGGAESGQSRDVIFLYYDRLFKDIIVIPDIDYITPDVSPTVYMINGYAIGYVNSKQEVLQPSDTLPVDENFKFDLPEPIANADLTITSCWINNTTKSVKYSSLEIARVLADGTQINTTFIDFYHIITLDTPAVFFKDANYPIPHYIMYQIAPGRYALKSQGNKTTDSKLRFSILF